MLKIIIPFAVILLLYGCEKDEISTYKLTIEINYDWPFDSTDSFTPADNGTVIKQYLNIDSGQEQLVVDLETNSLSIEGEVLVPASVKECDIYGRAVFEDIPEGLHSYLIISGNLEGEYSLFTIKTREKDQIFSHIFR